MKNSALIVLLLGLTLATVAMAQGGRNMGHGRNNSQFAGRQNNSQSNYQPRQYNNNKNWSSTNTPAFSTFDLNNDGIVTESEFTEARNNRISTRAQDGYLMKNIATSETFADLDLNADGQITPAEFATHQGSHQGQNQGLNRNSGPRRGGTNQ